MQALTHLMNLGGKSLISRRSKMNSQFSVSKGFWMSTLIAHLGDTSSYGSCGVVPGKEDVVTNASPRNKGGLGLIHSLWKDLLYTVSYNLAYALVYGVTARDWSESQSLEELSTFGIREIDVVFASLNKCHEWKKDLMALTKSSPHNVPNSPKEKHIETIGPGALLGCMLKRVFFTSS